MKTILDQDEDEVPPYSPVKVAVFVLLLGMIAFAGWRFLRAQAAVAAVAEASKDYRKLFPARASDAPEPKPVATAEGPASSIALLKIDDNMRAPKTAPPSAEPPPPPAAPETHTPPAAAAKVQAAALDSPSANRPAQKLFNQPRLNSGAFSGLNGGSGVSISGPGMSKVGAAPGAPAIPAIPGLTAAPAPSEKK